MPNVHTSRRSGFVLRNGIQRRETLWLAAAATTTTLAGAGTQVLILSLNAAALALRPFTVVRTRGSLLVRSDQETVSESFNAAVAKLVVSEVASTLGITAIPTPVTDASDDMFFLFEEWMGFVLAAANVEKTFSGAFQPQQIDSRAMRKVADGEDVVTVVERGAIGSGAILHYVDRMLIKLH